MQVASSLEAVLRRDRVIVLAGLIGVTILAWAYMFYLAWDMQRSMSVDSMEMGMSMASAQVRPWGAVDFAVMFIMWAVMMVAMMVPATLPLILLYRHFARKRLSPSQAQVGMAVMLAGYVAVWITAGLPVYAYSSLSSAAGSLAAVLPALLLMVGGAYQFTPLKRICHTRCSNPLFFLMQNWRPGAKGALRLGAIHGVVCIFL